MPLPALLSQAWVAFTIELDNEFEHGMPHRTARHGSSEKVGSGPWLTSAAMWWTCMRFVDEKGVSTRELEALARTGTNLNGMVRWGYVVVGPDPDDPRPKAPRSAWIIRATAKGRMAREVWEPLFPQIEQRWRARFGEEEIGRLRDSLVALIAHLDPELPDCLPILGYGLFNRLPEKRHTSPVETRDGSTLPLPALLAKALLAFALEFEIDSGLSLAICANILRVLDQEGVRLRDLPVLSGVSKESISMAMGVLQKKGAVVVGPERAGSATKAIRLTARGREVREAYFQGVDGIETRWRASFGEPVVKLREVLARLAGDGTAERSPLFRGLEPYPDGWRAEVRPPKTLPHYPMVLHRGGYPDGS